MLSEVVNALFITYIATEYHDASLSNGGGGRSSRSLSIREFVRYRHNQWILGLVVIVNLLDRVTGAAVWMKEMVESLLHLPKILLAAFLYTSTLYADCLRRYPSLKLSSFLLKVGLAFVKILPLYPFLAVLISCVFMFVISLWEYLQLPLEWLNAPIYYGTLYGPFSLVYFRVKQQIVDEATYILPTVGSAASSSSSAAAAAAAFAASTTVSTATTFGTTGVPGYRGDGSGRSLADYIGTDDSAWDSAPVASESQNDYHQHSATSEEDTKRPSGPMYRAPPRRYNNNNNNSDGNRSSNPSLDAALQRQQKQQSRRSQQDKSR